MEFLVSFVITALGLVISWGVYKSRGAASGMRATAWSLAPMALWMTGVTHLVVGLALNPLHWAGVVLAGLVALLYVTSGVMLARKAEAEGEEPRKKKGKGRKSPAAVEQRRPNAGSGIGADDDLADIEAILRKRGIS
jgi:hypothetical protein